jgi:hypothetical protein
VLSPKGRVDVPAERITEIPFSKATTSEEWVKAEVKRRQKRREAWYESRGDKWVIFTKKKTVG